MSPRPVHVVALFAAAALPAAFTLAPSLDVDTWWHLRVGELVAGPEGVIAHDPFSRLGRERPTPWLAYSWLYELGLYGAFDAAGPAGVFWVRTLLGAISTAAVFALLLRRWSWGTLAAVGLAAVVLMPMMRERPWHLTIAFTALTAGAVARLRGGTSAENYGWLPLMFAVWANVHIQFVIGWLVLGLACVFPGAARRRTFFAVTVFCVVMSGFNAYHARLLGVVWEYATQTAPLRGVSELAPPDPTRPWLWAAILLLGWAAVRVVRTRPIDWFRVALLLLALVLVLRMRRDVWFAAVAAAVVLRDGPAVALRRWVVGVVLAAFVGVRCLSVAGFGPRPDPERGFPAAAAAFVRDQKPAGPLFNSFDWGGYLIWALPGWPVTIDGRTNLYGSERFERSVRTWNGEPGWDADPDLVSAKVVIAPAGAPLAALLRARPEWRVAHEDATAVVFVAAR